MISRRTFLKRSFVAASGATLGVVYPVSIGSERVRVSQVQLTIPDLPLAWDGLTIAHLTDLHRSPFVSHDYLNRCIDLANSLQPDLIMFTGDYVTHGMRFRNAVVHGDINLGNPTRYAKQCAKCMGRARAKYGVFASLGNHDHWFDADIVTTAIESHGIRVLRNQHITVDIRGESLPIVGLGDLLTEGVDADRAFDGLEATFSVVLMHNPDSFATWDRSGSHLILAGHTHGGQVNLPFIGAPMSSSRYIKGLFRRGDSVMYVNRGIGLIFPSIRINCPPEIALLQLQRAG